MTDFSSLLQSGNAWLFIPSAILLGALHGLEPGHSKTMMAAFIVAIRGTVGQAVLLGLAATLSHTAVVWAIALAGLHFGAKFNTEATEPYLQLVSAMLIIGVALWMVWRTRREVVAHSHHHGEEVREINTGHGVLSLEVFENGVPPRWRIRFLSGTEIVAADLTVETKRNDGAQQIFKFISRGDYLESIEEIPEPHEFNATLRLSHGNHAHSYVVEFHEHDHHQADSDGLDVSDGEYADAHEREHAEDIRRRFANQHATTGQIVMFGLTGGLIPCPASITVLLLCLQLKKFTLGLALVLCFSIGLAATMVAVGAAAALSVQHASKRWSGLGEVARRAPYFSSVLIFLVGLYTAYLGARGIGVTHF
ncbi:nickel/cobalt efflux transporter [Hyphomicrobium sp.]|uniref:nickel/cobalt efflux transporter n=1 Tax=Hyphomicrobium sp. TaxID=82 RepID=UPI000F9CC846|nr:nickel/cobalt efflux transporter [Hyphomicrobium sp.]RUO97396.1 MAG: nickel/cobalt efflux transporter RcnA [Hyphomicrobium sp.]